MTELQHFIVDASVAIKLFIEQPLSDRAIALFDQLDSDFPPKLYVPDLFFIECANVLWQYVRRTNYPADKARQDITNLKEFALEVTPTGELVTEALNLAIAHQISAYDACYLALSQRCNAVLITADQKLLQALNGGSYLVRSLVQQTDDTP
jgi:predicted nucleic acid-binding protein